MDPDLEHVRRLLRADSCPSEVIQRVRQTIKEERQQIFYHRLAYACAILIALAASLASFKMSRDQKIAEHQEKQRIVSQASLSLAYIGQRLQETGSDTSEKILRGTLPGLMRGFRTATKAMIKNPSDNTDQPTEREDHD